MDGRLAAINRRVAEIADAWLADPQDAGVYARLVTAIRERRAYLHSTLDESVEIDATDGPVEELQPDEVLDDLGASRPPTRFGDQLRGDPRMALERLRRA